jgi:type II secretory pathway pseudopilin PulG
MNTRRAFSNVPPASCRRNMRRNCRQDAGSTLERRSPTRLVPSGLTTPGRRPALRSARGFTLVEIAIALGVIGFALVAIIGILPAGLQIQRDNRAETIINQDGTFWMEAIRNGARGLDELMEHVESIEIRDTITGTVINSYTNNVGFTTGSNIIGLLTTPAHFANTEARAVVTAISGAAAEKSSSAADRELAFRYQMTVEIDQPGTNALPFTALSANANPAPPVDSLESLYELRLNMSYNWVRDTQPGVRRQTYRSTLSRRVLALTNQTPEHFFFVP